MNANSVEAERRDGNLRKFVKSSFNPSSVLVILAALARVIHIV